MFAPQLKAASGINSRTKETAENKGKTLPAVPVAGMGTVQKKERTPNHTGLPDQLKQGVETLSGYSMDDVKVHYNSGKPAQLQALAYAQGSDIHVGPGQEQHLPHEAWHVVQQKQGRVQPTIQMKTGVPVNDDKGLEREADEMGRIAQLHSAEHKSDPSVRLKEIKAAGVAQRVIEKVVALGKTVARNAGRAIVPARRAMQPVVWRPPVSRVFGGFGMEGMMRAFLNANRGDVIVPGRGTFWSWVFPNHKTGQTWSEIGSFLVALGLSDFIKRGSEGRSIADKVELHPEEYVEAGDYQILIDSLQELLESRGIILMDSGVEVVRSEKEEDNISITLSNGEVIKCKNYEGNTGPGEERGQSERARAGIEESSIEVLTGEKSLHQGSWTEPKGDIMIREVGPTSIWAIEEVLLNLGYGYDTSGKWKWVGAGWDEKPKTKIVVVANPDFVTMESLTKLAKNTPRLASIINILLDPHRNTEIPVSFHFGKIDITKLPDFGGDIELTGKTGKKEQVPNISRVISSAGQVAADLFESQSETYWENCVQVMKNMPDGKHKTIIGFQGPDGSYYGISSSLALVDYAKANAKGSRLKMQAAFVSNMIKEDWKVISPGGRNPPGGIAHIAWANLPDDSEDYTVRE